MRKSLYWVGVNSAVPEPSVGAGGISTNKKRLNGRKENITWTQQSNTTGIYEGRFNLLIQQIC